jgi:glycosyltransferase involved in cell wall biosynthesis
MISVLMPVYNTAKFLQPALDSITKQTFTDFELVAIDDGSTDGSTEILRKHRDSRLRLICRPNKGLIATRNELLEAARGDLVAWMDSDDISLPDRLQRQVTHFDDGSLVCLGSSAQCVDPDGHDLDVERYPASHEEIVRDQQKGGAMRFPTTMMRRRTALAVGGFREPFKMGEDFDLFLRMSEIGRMANLPAIHYIYRKHIHSVSNTLGREWFRYRDTILALARERLTGLDRLQRGETIDLPVPKVNPRRLASDTLCEWSRQAQVLGSRSRAFRYAVAATRADPLSKAGWKAMARVALKPT